MFIKFFYLLVININYRNSVANISASDCIRKIYHILKNISHLILHCKKVDNSSFKSIKWTIQT